MLETLKIKNIAVIDSAEIHFRKGLNILSGETGAGKSIIIEAISLLLGSRANVELIRAGCDEATVEGLFDISENPLKVRMRERMEQLGFEAGSAELLIKRTVSRAGRHRIHVNGELATLSILQALCEGLIDLCGQHEHQSLLRSSTQLELLDRYGGLSDQTRALGSLYEEMREHSKLLTELLGNEAERVKRADFLKFQIDELNEAGLEAGEDVRLTQEKQLLQSAEARTQAAESARQILEAEELGSQGALGNLRGALAKLKALQALDSEVVPLREALERALAETEEASLGIQRYLSNVDLDPSRLQEVQDRLSGLADLRRKYGSSIEEMLVTLQNLENEASTLGNTEAKVKELELALDRSKAAYKKAASKISSARSKIGDLLAKSVSDELHDLNMPEAKFLVEITERKDFNEWTATGADLIQFLIQTNRGDEAKPLSKIASGGELSRLMLGIRRVISDKGGIGVYLFDEIDAGIGGKTAFQVGKKLKSVAKFNQVICITHLPQVASFANHHWIVRKSASGKKTLTEVVELNNTSRKEELARMLGGPELTKKSLENAAELLELAR
jgi:DNA repair protein RecN (Recombination protein N)